MSSYDLQIIVVSTAQACSGIFLPSVINTIVTVEQLSWWTLICQALIWILHSPLSLVALENAYVREVLHFSRKFQFIHGHIQPYNWGSVDFNGSLID